MNSYRYMNNQEDMSGFPMPGMGESPAMGNGGDIPVIPLPNPGEGGPVAPNGNNIPTVPLPNPGEGGPVFPNGSDIPVIPLPNPGEGGPVFPLPGPGEGDPVFPLPGPGEGGPVAPEDGNIPVIPLPFPGEGGPVATGPLSTIITVLPRPLVPCFFCTTNRFGNVRFLNAATGYNPFIVYISGQMVVNGLDYAQISQYGRVSSGYQTVTVSGLNGYVYIQKQIQIATGSTTTIAIVNTAGGLDLVQVSDVPCITPGNTACFRACNLSFNSGPLDVVLNNGFLRFNDVRFQEVTPFSRIPAGNYQYAIYRTMQAAPRGALVSSFVNVRPNTLYTLYIFNWNVSPDAIRTMVVEDRR